MKLLPRTLLAISLLVSACATKPLSSVDRTRYPSASISRNVECPRDYQYVDLTAKRARDSGAGFGLVGTIVGEIVASNSEGTGRSRFDKVVARAPLNVRDVTYRKFASTLEVSRLFRIRPNAAAAFELKVLNYGLEPANDRRLGGSVWLETRLVNGAGEKIWSKRVRGTSNTNAFLDDFERYPALWPQVMEEAIADVTRKTILYAE